MKPSAPFCVENATVFGGHLTGTALAERRATWSPDDAALLYHAFGASGCGDEKRVTNEFVIVDSTLPQPSGACEGSVILSTKGGKKGIGHPHWWPNHVLTSP